ncbi:hypothetical protein CJF31_00000573 [Rutstroemia sp. NJR-2017a BVV2]|nr:hypothetical protein CJF31_00000573 [Rutstroemia sp. NJR-2017a BVV2]
MNTIPPETLVMILQYVVDGCRSDKNSVLKLRLVCKAFDKCLKQTALKTIQLDFKRIYRFREIERNKAQKSSLHDISPCTENLYIDMTIVRDPSELAQSSLFNEWLLTYAIDEIEALAQMFDSVESYSSEMEELIESLQKYCLKQTTFTERDYNLVVWRTLINGPNITRLEVDLPLPVLGSGSTTAARLLASTFSCVANRSQQCKKIDILIIKHLSDMALNTLFSCPDSMGNTLKTFKNLKALVLTLKRSKSRDLRLNLFTKNFWSMLRKATNLQSLFISGWMNLKQPKMQPQTPFKYWRMRCLLYDSSPGPGLENLRCLELKSVEVEARMFYLMIEQNCHSLSELYLDHIQLNVHGTHQQRSTHDLWIGYPDIAPMEGQCTWVAPALRHIKELHLKVLRATKLSYHVRPYLLSKYQNFDLDDPADRGRSLEERFVEVVLGTKASISLDVDKTSATAYVSKHGEQHPGSHDSKSYQTYHNKTSLYKTSLDGVFNNHNTEASRELTKIVDVTNNEIDLLLLQIARRNASTLSSLENGELHLETPSTDTH